MREGDEGDGWGMEELLLVGLNFTIEPQLDEDEHSQEEQLEVGDTAERELPLGHSLVVILPELLLEGQFGLARGVEDPGSETEIQNHLY